MQALGLLFNLEAGDHSHQTALHYAAKNGHLKIAEYLVSDAHVYVNPAAANDNEKRTFVTPLDLAIAHRHADVANFIISKGNLSFKSKLIFTLSENWGDFNAEIQFFNLFLSFNFQVG